MNLSNKSLREMLTGLQNFNTTDGSANSYHFNLHYALQNVLFLANLGRVKWTGIPAEIFHLFITPWGRSFANIDP